MTTLADYDVLAEARKVAREAESGVAAEVAMALLLVAGALGFLLAVWLARWV